MPSPQGQQTRFAFDSEGLASSGESAPHLTEWAPQHWQVADDWRPVLERFLVSEAGQALGRFISARLESGAIIYPPQPFRALTLTPLAQVKLVILGQDPYHGPGQAEGLAFSVAPGLKLPPSLRNIFKEVARDAALGAGRVSPPIDGSLVRWARQGVLLLNTCLTVESGQPGSHAQRGWEALTDEIVLAVSAKQSPVVFMLWGSQAQAKVGLIAPSGTDGDPAKGRHLVLTANHPSPLSALRAPRPFLGCGHFSLANAFLQQRGCDPINWQA
jgi:uracil-DNA glycosylase